MSETFEVPRRDEITPLDMPAAPEFRLDRECFNSLNVDLRHFQTPDGYQKLFVQMLPGLIQHLSRFIDSDVSKSMASELPTLHGNLQSFIDLSEIMRATPAPQAVPRELMALERKIESFKVAMNLVEGLGQEKLGFSDWLTIKREAVELKASLNEYLYTQAAGKSGKFLA